MESDPRICVMTKSMEICVNEFLKIGQSSQKIIRQP